MIILWIIGAVVAWYLIGLLSFIIGMLIMWVVANEEAYIDNSMFTYAWGGVFMAILVGAAIVSELSEHLSKRLPSRIVLLKPRAPKVKKPAPPST